MSLHETARQNSLIRSNPVAVWWAFLSLVSVANIAVWIVLFRQLHKEPVGFGVFGIELMFLLCGAYVFGCAFRSFLPRADVQRICLLDTWLSCVTVGRTVATVAEMSFAAQWAVVLYMLGTMTGADTVVIVAYAIVPMIAVAQCLSWHGVLTRNYLSNAIENSIWAVAFFMAGIALIRLMPEFDGAVRIVLAVAVAGIAGFIAFLVTVDVPMYLGRWRSDVTNRVSLLRPLDGLRDASTRWIVTHNPADWKGEMAWMFQRCGLGEPGTMCVLRIRRAVAAICDEVASQTKWPGASPAICVFIGGVFTAAESSPAPRSAATCRSRQGCSSRVLRRKGSAASHSAPSAFR